MQPHIRSLNCAIYTSEPTGGTEIIRFLVLQLAMESEYELEENFNNTKMMRQSQAVKPKWAWTAPFVIVIVLLCLMLIILVVMLIVILVYLPAKNGSNVTTCAGMSSNHSPNYTELANYVVTQLGNSTQSCYVTEIVASKVFIKFQCQSNFTEPIGQILQTTRNSAEKLTIIVNTLSNLQATSTSTAGVVDNMLTMIQELLVLHNDSTALPTSCKELKESQPMSLSGVYLLADGTALYCNMDTLCGSGGGWTRIAYLDMSNGQSCPSGLQYFSSAGLRTCGKKATQGASCDSVQFPSHGIRYSQVCGKAVGYQYGTPDAVHPSRNIDSVYIDGVSITHGSPRQHIWSLMVGVHSNKSYYDNCPCAGGTTPQSFVGNDYFCESANPTDSWDPVFYSTDPLWDGEGCDAAEASCCSDPRLPWFNKTLGAPTTDYLEMRLCVDQGTHTEDIKLSSYEIYVK